MQKVFLASYAIEAELLKATDFPPLKRPLADYINSKNDFFGFMKGDEITGVVEIKHHEDYTHIQSLVVHPDHFRQGIAKQLMEFVLSEFGKKLLMVETGVDNGPAIRLYEKFDFEEVHQWDTYHGVRKIRLEKT